jgi:glycogen operon protein
MGDEVRRTQGGNNNAYCQDDETSWLDWGLVSKHADVLRFVTLLASRRARRNPALEVRRVSLAQLLAQARREWHGVALHQPDWGEDSHSLALEAELGEEGIVMYIALNAYWEPLEFELPRTETGGARPWRRWIDTSLASPNDITVPREAPVFAGSTYPMGARSVVVLYAERGPAPA